MMKKNILLIGMFLVGMAAVGNASTTIMQLDVRYQTINPDSIQEGWIPWMHTESITVGRISISGPLSGTADRGYSGGLTEDAPYARIYRDWAYINNTTGYITLSGFEANQQYEIAIYSYDSKYPGENQTDDWYANSSYLLTTICGSGEVTSADQFRYSGTATADGSGVIVLSATDSYRYIRVNGIEIISFSDCYNFTPEITVATSIEGNYWYVPINTPTAPQVTATDDGRPFVEGCVTSGTPATLLYQWDVISGPGTPTFSPSNTVLTPDITFPVEGVYELQLTVADGTSPDSTDEGPKAVTAQVMVRAKDPANDGLLAFWEMEENAGTAVADSTFDNDGAFTTSFAEDPNWIIPGAISGASPNSALEFHGPDSEYVAITPDPLADPNLLDTIYEITISAWVKVDSQEDFLAGSSVVMEDYYSYRFFRSDNNLLLTLRHPGQIRADIDTTQYDIFDGEWHHVCSTYNGEFIRIYLDGYMVDGSNVSGWGPVGEATAGSVITIGGYAGTGYGSYAPWKGGIDQVRIYNYGLDEAAVQALTLEGINAPPVVNAGEDFEYLLSTITPADLNGMVFDMNDPTTVDILWTVDSTPEGGAVNFTDDTEPVTTAMFNLPGEYVLKLTATDASVSKSDTVTVTVTTKTCADVIADGLTLLADISGPSGTPDCYIDLYDLQALAVQWLSCNDPENVANCIFPY
ncbi:MAG: LamG domain-containing protein [Sedimentisphaerales bacterium]|nr:LamG domain-containing protein [Sedimentisphaerales bacterium]